MSSPRRVLSLALMLSFVSTFLAGCFGGKYESADYRVVMKDGAFEVRDYPAMTLVSTSMQKRGEDGSFMKLFRFISGRNDHSQKIAMTTPVLMTGMESGTMSFVLPKAVAERGAPAPSNPDVSLVTRAAGRYASLRYQGFINQVHGEAMAEKLVAWTKEQKLSTRGEPVYAFYNPPWTPGFMRRNEVLIQLVPPHP